MCVDFKRVTSHNLLSPTFPTWQHIFNPYLSIWNHVRWDRRCCDPSDDWASGSVCMAIGWATLAGNPITTSNGSHRQTDYRINEGHADVAFRRICHAEWSLYCCYWACCTIFIDANQFYTTTHIRWTMPVPITKRPWMVEEKREREKTFKIK